MPSRPKGSPVAPASPAVEETDDMQADVDATPNLMAPKPKQASTGVLKPTPKGAPPKPSPSPSPPREAPKPSLISSLLGSARQDRVDDGVLPQKSKAAPKATAKLAEPKAEQPPGVMPSQAKGAPAAKAGVPVMRPQAKGAPAKRAADSEDGAAEAEDASATKAAKTGSSSLWDLLDGGASSTKPKPRNSQGL